MGRDMAVYLDVFLEQSRLPTCLVWAESISEEGFSFKFPQLVDLTKHTGYLPVMFHDEESGFEFSISTLNEANDAPDEVRTLQPAVDAVAGFRFSEVNECDAATVAAAVLAHLTNGVFFDPQDGRVVQGSETVAEVRIEMEAAAKRGEQRKAKHAEKLRPLKWAKAFEDTLRQVHPDYRLSSDFRGQLVECLRRDESGVFLSQNCVKMHESYRHCFAILLTPAKLSPALCSPFVLGSRFDHNSTISHAYNADYRSGLKWQVAPQEWHSEYRSTLRGTRQWVGTRAKSAEQFLLPGYLSHLVQGAERLTSLYRDAITFIELWKISDTLLRSPIGDSPLVKAFAQEFGQSSSATDWDERLVVYCNALCVADANGFSAAQLLRHRRQTINTTCSDIALATKKYLTIPSDVRNAALFVAYVEDFLTVQAELPSMVMTIENLKASHPKGGAPSDPHTPWWKMW